MKSLFGTFFVLYILCLFSAQAPAADSYAQAALRGQPIKQGNSSMGQVIYVQTVQQNQPQAAPNSVQESFQQSSQGTTQQLQGFSQQTQTELSDFRKL